MRLLLLLTFAIFQICNAFPAPSSTIYSSSSTYSSNNVGELVCGTLKCPENTNRCVVTKKTSEDNKWIVTKRQCFKDCMNEIAFVFILVFIIIWVVFFLAVNVTAEDTSKEENEFGITINSVVKSSVGSINKEEQEKIHKSIEKSIERTRDIFKSNWCFPFMYFC